MFKQLLEQNKNLLIALGILLLYFAFLFGFTGVLVFIGILILVTPVYFIFDLLNLETAEKLLLSFPASVALYPSFVYYLGFIFSSIRTAIVVTFAILGGYYGLALHLKNKKKIKDEAYILIGLLLLIGIVWLFAIPHINSIAEPQFVTNFLDCLETQAMTHCMRLY